MPNRDVASAQISNLTDNYPDVTVSPIDTVGPTGQKEFFVHNHKWTQYFAYYMEPEVKIAIDTRALWTIGKGYKAGIREEVILGRMKGRSKETFNQILKNLIAVSRINGVSYAHIIRQPDGVLLNLKPLNPGTIREVYNAKGILLRYEQTSRTPEGKDVVLQPNEMFSHSE